MNKYYLIQFLRINYHEQKHRHFDHDHLIFLFLVFLRNIYHQKSSKCRLYVWVRLGSNDGHYFLWLSKNFEVKASNPSAPLSPMGILCIINIKNISWIWNCFENMKNSTKSRYRYEIVIHFFKTNLKS